MIVLDASVLIAFLFTQDVHHERAVGLLRRVVDEPLGASPVTLAEVLVVPTRLGRVQAALQMLHDIAVSDVPLQHGAAVELARMRAESGLKMPDCCVLLAALPTGATVATFDDRLAEAAVARGHPVLTR